MSKKAAKKDAKRACILEKGKYGNRRLVDGSSPHPHVPCFSASLLFPVECAILRLVFP